MVCGLWFVHLAVQVVTQTLLCWTHPAPTMGAGDTGNCVLFSKAVFMSRLSQQNAQTTDGKRDPVVGVELCSARQSSCHHFPSKVDKPQMEGGNQGRAQPVVQADCV